MAKTIIVSNRLPVNIKRENGNLIANSSPGGLATALSSMLKEDEFVWVGWPGGIFKEQHHLEVKAKLDELKLIPVFLSKQEVKEFYEGFSNAILWPNFHYFPQYVEYNEKYWETYKIVNDNFLSVVLEHYEKGDKIWIQDYHLLLLPDLLRKRLGNATIGFFQHIPFPSFEIFRMLPWREELIQGMLGADLIGFHTYDDVRHFLSSANKLLGVEHTLMEMKVDSRAVSVDAFPIGIDYQKFSNQANNPETIKLSEDYKTSFKNSKLILSIDRLDYSKGIPQRLMALDLFFERYPQYREQVTLILTVVPSRDNVKYYKFLKDEIDNLVGNINGKYSSLGWTPIQYFYKNFSFDSLCALYTASEIALITPIRDGMNLVCKEFVACRKDLTGVLILSERAGAAKTLSQALHVNPNNVEEIADSIYEALNMPLDEQKDRMGKMQEMTSTYDVMHWLNLFFERLDFMKEKQASLYEKMVGNELLNKIVDQFQLAQKRLIILEYHGVLIPYNDQLKDATPDDELIQLLCKLSSNEGNKVVISSGGSKDNLGEWFHNCNVDMIAEHGLWSKQPSKDWELSEDISTDWKDDIAPILTKFVNRTPGSYLEHKSNSLAWHYRLTDLGLGEVRAREISTTLKFITHNLNLDIFEGNKVIEIKNSLINKSKAYKKFAEETDYDLIFIIGRHDQKISLSPHNTISINVGQSSESAMYSIPSAKEVRILLSFLSTKVLEEN